MHIIHDCHTAGRILILQAKTVSECTVVALVLIIYTASQPVGNLTPQVKYVQPLSGSNLCAVGEPCTLNQYANNPEQYFLSNTTFIFLPGDHQLSYNIILNGVQNVTFQGMSVDEGSVTIRFGPLIGLNFSDSDGIEIKSLNFILSDYFEYGLMFLNTSDIKLHDIMISTDDEDSMGHSALVSQASVIKITNSSFMGISGQFGATLLAIDSSEITFMGTNNFASNSAKLGGAIHTISSTLRFYDVASFIDNMAVSNNSAATTDSVPFDSGMGGAVYANNSLVIMEGCGNFITNEATCLGGAIAAMNSTVLINGSTCRLSNQSNWSSPMGIVFNNNCVSIKSGGAIYTENSKVKICNTSYVNNFSPVHGGAVYLVQSNATLYNINAANNVADSSYGGAVRFYQCTQAHINGESSFLNNHAEYFGGAIEFCDVQSVSIAGINYFEGNSAEFGGAVDIVYCSEMVVISGNIMFNNNTATQGGAMYVYSSVLNSIANFMEYRSNIAENNGGAIFLTSNKSAEFHGDARFIDNTAGQNGGALLIDTNSEVHFYGDTVFKTNHAERNGGAISCNMNSQISFHGDSVFQKNHADSYGGAIYNLNSKIIYDSASTSDSEFQFDSNFADYGGAIATIGTTKLIINPQTEVNFTENVAQYVGGTIFVDIYTSSECSTVTADIRPECFIMLNACYRSFDSSQFSLTFVNNNAKKSGSVLYGGSLNECRGFFKSDTECNVFINDQKESALEIMEKISSITPENDNSTKFSSKPNKLCIYNGNSTDHCGSPTPMNIIPGQTFNLTLLIIDHYENPVDGVVVRSTQNNTDDYLIDHGIIISQQFYQTFVFHVLVSSENLVSYNSKLEFSLFLEESCRNNTHIDISLLPCPFGFEFSIENRKCQCTNVLQKLTEDCNIDDTAIGRSRNNFWLHFTTDYILLHGRGCPLSYCKDAKLYIPLNDSDIQCNDNRTGKLCGACKGNYSLELGSLVCTQECTTFHLFLILLFGVLGMLLIVVLFLLHLTVAAGTINGLLFYANIVQANYRTFLEAKTSNPFIAFSSAFIGWLNLDFGINVCFYNGMDIYAYSWLQFLFPIYLWILMLIIIVSARYSRKVVRTLGQNPVAVLATVLLISYGKMLKAIIVPLPWAKLENVTQDNPIHSEYVWLYDGNIRYFSFQHMILVVFASCVLLFLFLPYSFLLLCGHWLQTKSHWRALSWINKLKPFMDAYYAPFRKSERHWIGLLLLTRSSLILTVAFATAGIGNQNLNLVIVSSVTAALSLFKGRVYDKWYNDFLESFFLLNLCILSIATLYVRSDERVDYHNSVIVSSLSVMIAFVFFIGIMVFHAYQQQKKLQLFQHLRNYCSLKKQHDEEVYSDHELKQSVKIISKSSVNLRELLLDDDS